LNAIVGGQNRSTDNGELTFQQFLPHLDCETGVRSREFVALRGAELRWSRDGWSSPDWGNVHPPFTGVWTLTKIMRNKMPLDEAQFDEWKRDHPQWGQLVIEEPFLRMAGTTPKSTYGLALDYSGAVPVYRLTSDSVVKFSGVFMSNGLVKDSELSLMVADDVGESDRIYRATDKDAIALLFLRTNSEVSDPKVSSRGLPGVTQVEPDQPAPRPEMTPDDPKIKVDRSKPSAVDPRNPRSVVEAYIALALAGDVAKATALAKNAPADPKHIAEIPEFFNVQRLKIQTVYVNDPAKPTQALATSEAVKLDEDHKQPDGQRDGYMVFTLERTDENWFVIDIDFESESGAEKELKRFLEANPGSIGLPPQP